MPDNKESKLAKFRSELLAEMREQNRTDTEEIVKRIIGTVQVPHGYTKCMGCGRLIPDDLDECPYCEKPEPQPETSEDDDDASGGILGILGE